MEEIEDDNGRKFTEVKPNNLAQQNQQRLLNQNPQPQPQQVRALQIENRAINDVNNDEIQEDEPLNPEGPGFFKKHWKSILIIILVILVVSGSIFAVSFLTRTKFKNIKSLVLTRQLNQFETYQYGKNSDICATSVNAKQNSKHCQKVEADYKFYVLNITDRPYLPNYIEYESNEKDKSELDVMKVDLKSNFIGLWLKSLDVIIDGKKFELVKTRFEFTDPNFKFDYEDKRHLNEFLNINLDNKKEVEKLLLAQEIALDPEEELEKIKKTTSTIIFFNMWDSGEISSIFVPEDLPEFAKIFMKDLIKDYSPNLDKTNYDGGKRLLQGEYSLKDSTIRKSLTKSNIEKVQLPEDSLFESNIDYKFNDVFDLTETNQNTKIGFFHSKKKGEMPSKRNQNLFSNNFEVNNEEDELQNFIPNFDMSEISTTSSVKTELKNKYVSHNETELFVFLASQNQFEVHIGDLHDVNIVEIKGSGKLKTGEDEIKLTDVGYHYGESKYIELENYLKGKVHYKKQFKSQIDIRDDIKEVLFNEDVSQIHSIVYPAFNVDVYGVRCHMHIVLEVCPSQDYIESKIVIGSVGLFSFDLFSVKKQVGMSDSIDKMFNYIKKATNVVATTLSIIDRFLNSDLLKKLKDKVDEVGAKTGIDTNDIFVDYFGKFLSELDEKLLTLSQDFKEKLIQNKNYLLNPLISFYKKYETIVKDIYDKYIKSSSEKVDNFLLERQTEITDFLDGLPKLTALFYPDMIEFIQSGQDKIKEKINNLPGTIKIGFVNTASRKLTEILNKTQELLEKVKEKIISYFDLIPFEELKKSKDYISGEINSLLTSSGSEIAKYKKFIEDHFFIEEFNPISLAGQKAFEKIEVNLEAIKTHMKNAMKELKIEEYREIFNLLVEYMKKVLNIDVKDSLLNFPEFKSIVNEFLKNYLTEFNFNNKNSLINSISDLAENALNVAKSTFYEKFIRVNGIVSSFKTKLQNLSNMNNYNSLIESIFSLTFDEFNLNKNDLLAIINKYLEVTEFGVSICEDRYKLLNEDITFISNKINEILDKIKSNSLDEILNIKKIDEIATTLGDFIDLLNYFDIDILDSLRPEKFRSKIEKTHLELEILIQNRFTFYLENAKYEIDNLKAKMNEIVSKFPRNQVKCEEDILKNCFLVKNKECIFNYYSIRKDLTLPKEFNNFISSAINQAKEFLVKLKNQVAELTIIKDEILNDLFSSAFKNYKSLEASVDMNLNIFFDSIYKKVDTFIKSSSSYINEISAQVLEFLTRKIINSYDKIPKFILNEIDNLKKILENIKIKDKSCENLETNNFFFKIRCQWSADINEKIISITNEFIQIRKNNFFNFFDPFAAKIETLPKLIKNKVKQEFNNIKIQFDNIFNNTQMLINKSISDTISYLQKNLNNLLDTLEGTFVSKVESMITQIENKNKENNIQLNGYFTVSKLYSTFSILKEINIFELDFGKILNFLNEGGVVNKDIFDGVTNINSLVKTNFSVELSKLLSIQKGLLKNEIEIDFDYLLDGLDKNINSQDFSPLINGFFEAFSSKFSTEFDNQKINFLVDFNTWKLKFINEISAFSNLPSISQNFKENLLNFISNITSELTFGLTNYISYLQDFLLYNQSEYKLLIKRIFFNSIKVTGAILDENMLEGLKSIGYTESYINNIYNKINSQINNLLDKKLLSVEKRRLEIDDFTNNLISQISELIRSSIDSLLKDISPIIKKITDTADYNFFNGITASQLKKINNLNEIVVDKEVDSNQKLLDYLLEQRKNFVKFLDEMNLGEEQLNKIFNSILANKNLINLLPQTLKFNSDVTDDLLSRIKSVVSKFEEFNFDINLQDLRSKEALIKRAKEIFSSIVDKAKTSSLQYLKKNAEEIINGPISKFCNDTTDFVFNELSSVITFLKTLVIDEKQDVTLAQILGVFTVAAEKAIKPISGIIESKLDSLTDQFLDFLEKNKNLTTFLLPQLEKIENQEIRNLLIENFKIEIDISISPFVKAKKQIILDKLKSKVSKLENDIIKLKNDLIEFLNSKTTNSSFITIYSFIETLIEKIGSYIPEDADFNSLITSSDDDQKKFFLQIANNFLGDLDALTLPMDMFVKATLEKYINKAEEYILLKFNEHFNDPIDFAFNKIEELTKEGVNKVFSYIEEVATKLATKSFENNINIEEIKFISIPKLSFNEGTKINLKDLYDSIKQLGTIFRQFKSFLTNSQELQRLKDIFYNTLNFAKNGFDVFKNELIGKFPLKKFIVQKAELYKNYTIEILKSPNSAFMKKYEEVKARVIDLPKRLLDISFGTAEQRLKEIVDKNKGTFVEGILVSIDANLYKFQSNWNWDYGYEVMFSAGPVPIVLRFSIGANVFFNFSIGLNKGIALSSAIGGSVYLRASGGVTVILLEINGFVEGIIIKLTGSLGLNLNFIEFSVGTQICFTGEFGEVNVGLQIKSGIPYTKEVCSGVEMFENKCEKILGIFKFVCKVVKVVKFVCKVIEYTSWKHDFLKYNIVSPYVFQKCYALEKSFKRKSFYKELPFHK